MVDEQIEHILKNIQDHEERIKKIEERVFTQEPKDVSFSGLSKKISISEFTCERNPADDLQRTVVFAYFLDKYDSKEFFNSEDIETCFIKSKSTKPDNINDKINKCIKKGWISEHTEKKSGKKSFYITTKGITAVESNFIEIKK